MLVSLAVPFEDLVAVHLACGQQFVSALRRDVPGNIPMLLDQLVGTGPDFALIDHDRLTTEFCELCPSAQKLGIDFGRARRPGDVMDDDRRDLINHLGSELAGILEAASAEAATLRRGPLDRLADTIEALDRAAADAQTLSAAMLALTRRPN